MTAELNHTIVWSSDARKSAAFLAEMLSLPSPVQQFHFMVVALGNGVSMDFADQDGPITSQHYAFLVDEARFDAGLALIREKGVPHWADPARRQPGEINHRLGGRGVYFADPDGHFLEILTLPENRELPA
jgi:catechol 2,3-dioxygenase-like lactoylglutathione lyase family enzyme